MHSPITHYVCLDEEFDAPDAEADYELCRAVVAGRMGLHPDGWGTHYHLNAVMPRGFPGNEDRPSEPYSPPVDRTPATVAEIAERVRQVEERERKRPGPQPIGWWIKDDVAGEIGLTCDDCNAKFRQTAQYGRGKRNAAAAMLRQIGRSEGWTCIVGRDRCPVCSLIPAPPCVDQHHVV